MADGWRRGLRLLAAGLLAFATLLPSGGESDTGRAPIRVGWVPLPALMEPGQGEGAAPTGFMNELAREIGDRAGREVTFHRYDEGRLLLADMHAGRIDMLAGIAALPVLKEGTLLSAPVGQTPVRLFTHAETARRFDARTASGLSLAVIGGLAAEDLGPLLQRNRLVPHDTVSGAIGALLLNRVQGIVGPADTVLRSVEAAGQEGLIRPVGPVLTRVSRVVSLRVGLTDLRPVIDAALDTLEADGTLGALRDRWGVDPPPEPGAPLIVALPHHPPYSIVHEDGTLSGFAADVIYDLSARAGLRLRFRPALAGNLAYWPDAVEADMTGLLPLTAAEEGRILMTRAVAQVPQRRITRAGEEGAPVRRLGVLPHHDRPALAAEQAAAEVLSYADGPALLQALRAGRLDAALVPEAAVAELLAGAEDASAFAVAAAPDPVWAMGIALRPGLEPVRARLDAVVPAYLASPRYQSLQARWFEPPPLWTPERLRLLVVALCTVIAMLAAGVIWQDYRRSVAEARRSIAADLIGSMPVGLLLIGADDTVTYVNEGILAATPDGARTMRPGAHYPTVMKRLVDGGVFDLEGRTPDEMLHLLAVEGLKDGFRQEFRMADGGSFVRSARKLSRGETLIVRQDVTEERARLRQIEGLNRALADKVRLSTAVNEELRAFAYATSHDLKSPLNSAIMLADLLLEEERTGPGEDRRDLLTDLRTTLRGMAGLIDDVRLYTDVIVTEAPVAPCDLQAMAEELVQQMQPRLRAAGATVAVDGLPRVDGRSLQLRQLLSNLLENALKFRAPERPLQVALAGFDGEDGAGFTVRDNGIGIDPAYHERVFQLFQKLHPAALYPGNGLGLPICHRIALAHGGRIAVTSALGEGATFTVTFGKDLT